MIGMPISLSASIAIALKRQRHGTETFAYDLDGGEGEKLATCIQDQIVDALTMVDRGVKAN